MPTGNSDAWVLVYHVRFSHFLCDFHFLLDLPNCDPLLQIDTHAVRQLTLWLGPSMVCLAQPISQKRQKAVVCLQPVDHHYSSLPPAAGAAAVAVFTVLCSLCGVYCAVCHYVSYLQEWLNDKVTFAGC